jgi:hypothetical protein
MSPPRAVIACLLAAGAAAALGCSKSNRERAIAITGDESVPTADALARAAHAIWPDAPNVHSTITAEASGSAWRVFVVTDRPDQPTIEKTADAVQITFYEWLDGHTVEQQTDMLAAGASRHVTEVLVANRYRVDVLGRPMTIVAPERSIVRNEVSVQMFDSWEPADLQRLQPYDLLMNQQAQLTLPRR